MKIADGFTLIELMVTVAILSILTAIAIPAYNGYIETSRQTECQNEIAAIALAEEEFFLQYSAYIPVSANAAAIAANSNGLYVPSTAVTAGTANCTFTTSLAAGYTITATGANKLPNTFVITKTK